MDNFILCQNTCWVLLGSFWPMISWELRGLRMKEKNICLRTTKDRITFSLVSRKLSWVIVKQKPPQYHWKLQFLERVLKYLHESGESEEHSGYTKPKLQMLVWLRAFRQPNHSVPNFCPLSFCYIFPLWPVLELQPRVGCHQESTFIQAINANLLSISITILYCWENHNHDFFFFWWHKPAPQLFPLKFHFSYKMSLKSLQYFSICYVINALKCALYNYIKTRSMISVN